MSSEIPPPQPTYQTGPTAGQPYRQPYQPYPPPPRRGTPGWVWALIGCGCLAVIGIPAILAAILFPVFAQAREAARTTSCLSNEKQMTMGLLMYAQDYDDTLPPSTRWMAVEAPYVKVGSVFHCPSLIASGPTAYGYAMDSRMSGQVTTKIANPQTTPLLFDSSNTAYNATDAGTSFPSPARHHSGSRQGNNVAYMNGSARLTPTLSPDSAPSGGVQF